MIDYQKIADSIKYYEEKGYARMEAPWWVSKDIMNITKPKDIDVEDYFISVNRKCLVASGEQSFLYMANKGRLPKGRYFTVTPCFRNESIGILSKKCFIKTELIDTVEVNTNGLWRMIDEAMEFFKRVVLKPELLKMVEIPEYNSIAQGYGSYDITYGGIELGSYGIRTCEFLDWTYGTGCAEPRLSRAIKIVSKK